MDLTDYIPALRLEIETLTRAVVPANLSVPVAACPGWSLADLLWHVGEVHHFWTEIVAGELQDPDQVVRAVRPDDADLRSWSGSVAERLINVLAKSNPRTTVWTWSDQHDIAFVYRRMTQETAVHLWDVQEAVGNPTDIDIDVATDGIGEFIEFMVPDGSPITERLAIQATDSGTYWTLGPGHDAVATIAGPASDLLLALWRRLPLAVVTITGDHQSADRFVNRTDLN
jgi:uncharacterized protein (TIGR03083 family)